MPPVGDPAPPIIGTNILTQQPFDLSDHLGKGVLLQFHGISYCPPCQMGVPVQQELVDELKSEGELVEFVVLSVGEDALAVQNALSALGLSVTMPWLVEPEVAEAYEIGGAVPSFVMLDEEHRICWTHVGLFGSTAAAHKSGLRTAVVNCLPAKQPQLEFDTYWAVSFLLLFGGVGTGGGGIGVLPGGGVVPIDPRDWLLISPAKRDALIGLAASELAKGVQEPGARARLERAGLEVARGGVGSEIAELRARIEREAARG